MSLYCFGSTVYPLRFTIPMRGNEVYQVRQVVHEQQVYDPHEG